MATYKVLQDIEAEDKLLGPLTLKQFIFAGIFIGLGFINFMTITSGAPSFIKLFVFSVLLPFMLVFGFLAAPIGKDQPNDVWLLARLRYLFKPHKRIWNQDGISELVTITVPKHEIPIYTNGLDQNEVKSRLHALASTMDSRGWAIKNVTTNLYAQPGYLTSGAAAASDRLVSPSELPQEVAVVNVQPADDMLDTSNNPIAQHLDMMVKESAQSHRQQAVAHMHNPEPTPTPQDYWFMNQQQPQQQSTVPQDYATFSTQQVVAPGTDDDTTTVQENAQEKALGEKLAAEHRETLEHSRQHMKTLQPLHDSEGKPIQPTPTPQATSQTVTPNPAILGLAHNDDLNVATIAREAKKLKGDDDEVVISLH